MKVHNDRACMERYVAFISYSHRDEREARWLHRALETYRFPRALIGQEGEFSLVPRKLPPVFRDRDELPASGDLSKELRAALATSRFQIVLCSPAAARSHWVNEEILQFKRMHGEHRTLALIVSGEPYAGGDEECFPPALRYHVDKEGNLTDEPAEPIAADIRKGKDGRKLALQKLIAGLAGVRLDDLVRRESARRQQRLTIMFAASTAIAVVTIGLAIYAEIQRRVAVEQRELADRSLEFLVGTFEIANPATENPRTITALTILDRASRRAADEFRNDPAVSSRLLRTTGSIYANLGLPSESERDLRAALARTPERGEARANTLLALAGLARRSVDAEAARTLVAQAAEAYDHSASYAPPLNAELAVQQANLAYLEADYSRAAEGYANAVSLYRLLAGDHVEKIASTRMSEGYARVQALDYDGANKAYAEAAQLISAKFGAGDVRTARALHAQAFAHFASDRAAQAAPPLQQAIAIYRRVLGSDHPNLGEALVLLGRVDSALGRTTQAMAAFAQARAIFTKLYGSANASLGDIDFFSAEAEAGRGRFDQALDHVSRAKANYDANYGPDDPDQAELLLLRARILRGSGKNGDALNACRDAMNLQLRLGVGSAIQAAAKRQCANIAS